MHLKLAVFTIAVALQSCAAPKSDMAATSANYSDIDVSSIDTTDFLFAQSATGGPYESGYPFVFKDQKGQVAIPEGTYQMTFDDTLKTFAIVMDSSYQFVGIGRDGQRLFEVFRFDNGPDYVEGGLFRVLRDGKIGYANTKGEVVIPCQFECAYPFYDEYAKVAKVCSEVEDGEYTRWESDEWYFIDRSGQKKQ